MAQTCKKIGYHNLETKPCTSTPQNILMSISLTTMWEHQCWAKSWLHRIKCLNLYEHDVHQVRNGQLPISKMSASGFYSDILVTSVIIYANPTLVLLLLRRDCVLCNWGRVGVNMQMPLPYYKNHDEIEQQRFNVCNNTIFKLFSEWFHISNSTEF